MIFKRKLYGEMLEWKQSRNGKTVCVPVYFTPFL